MADGYQGNAPLGGFIREWSGDKYPPPDGSPCDYSAECATSGFPPDGIGGPSTCAASCTGGGGAYWPTIIQRGIYVDKEQGVLDVFFGLSTWVPYCGVMVMAEFRFEA